MVATQLVDSEGLWVKVVVIKENQDIEGEFSLLYGHGIHADMLSMERRKVEKEWFVYKTEICYIPLKPGLRET